MKQTDDVISRALEHLRISTLTLMQEDALRAGIDRRDMIILSPTGSGKTLAFLLPLLRKLKTGDVTVQALILVPSRELALQIDSVFKTMNTSWKSCCCYGGHPIAEEKKSILGNHPAVIIGTPGRIADHLRKGNLSAETIHTLAIDEFDKCLELGFQDEMAEIISQLSGVTKRILLSATDIDELPDFTGITNPITLNYLQEEKSTRLELLNVFSPSKDKIDTLYNLLCTLGNKSSIVFCNHRESVERVSKLLKERGMYNEAFHGGMEQPDREKSLYKFRNGSCYVLVSTDLAARGLDVPEMEHVIHYHLPINEEAFTHRNGRTARWEAKGVSFLIRNEQEQLPEYLHQDIEEYVLPDTIPLPSKPAWTTLYISKGKKDKVNKIDIVGFLYKKGKLAKEDIGRVDVKEHNAFVAIRCSKIKQLLTLIRGEKIKGIKILVEEAK